MNRRILLPFFLFWLLVPLLSGALHGQDTPPVKITKYFDKLSLRLALIEIKNEYQLDLKYDTELVRDIDLQNVRIVRIPLDQAMQMILRGTRLAFDLTGPRSGVIREKTDAEEENFATKYYAASRFDFTVEGVVIDETSGETLPNATVMLRDSREGAMTNLDGYFTLFKVPSDTVVLIVRYLGYATRYVQLNPETDLSALTIPLRAVGYELDAVVISAEADESHMMNSQGISHISISPAQLSTLPSLGEKDIFRSLQLLPGISGTNEASSGLYVRGGTPDQNLILFDGFTVYHVDHFFGFFSAFNADAIKDVQLYKGGFGAQYGGRLSSVVEMTGKSGNKNEFDLGLGISALSVKARVEVPVNDKLTLFFAGRRSYTDIIQSGLYNNIAELVSPDAPGTSQGPQRGPGGGGRFFAEADPSFYFYDLNAKATYTPSDKDVLSFSFYNGQDNLDNSFDNNFTGFGGGGGLSNETIDLTNWGNWGLSGKWGRQWNDRFYSNAVLAYSNYYSQRERATLLVVGSDTAQREIRQGLSEDNDVRDLTLRIDNEYQLSGSNQLKFGLQSTRLDVDYSYLVNDTVSVISRNGQGTTYAAYLQDEWQLFDKLSLSVGLRGTWYDVNEKFYIEPRASLSYQLSKRLQLKGAWGRYHQFANRVVREDVLQGSRDFWLLADDAQIPVSFAEHYIAGFSYETPTWLFDVEAYYKKLDGLSEYSERISQTRRDVTYEELFYNGTGATKGIEFLAQKKIGDYTGWISYTLSQTLYDFPAFGDDPFPALHDQTHEFKIVNSYKVSRWNFGATWVYGTGKPYTAPIGGYQLTLLDGNTLDYVHVGEKNAFRLPAYHRMDVSATYNFYLGNSKANMGLSLFNLYGRRNIWYKEFEVVDGELAETNVQLLGLTPNLFFNFNLK